MILLKLNTSTCYNYTKNKIEHMLREQMPPPQKKCGTVLVFLQSYIFLIIFHVLYSLQKSVHLNAFVVTSKKRFLIYEVY